jgi:hypothetical protein
MEASLPISAAISSPPQPAKTVARPNANAPSAALPLRFTVAGLLALFLGTGWLVAKPQILAGYHYSPAAIAVTHLFVLGWLASTVMGAMYQLVPVALETRLYSERLARWQFVLHAVGFVGMVWMFRTYDMKQVGHFASVFTLGLGMFVYNLARTLARAPKWNVTASAIASALFWISFAALAGLSLAAARSIYETTGDTAGGGAFGILLHGLRSLGKFVLQFSPLSAMHAHAHLGVVGFMLMLIVGVSYKLIPMFTLSEVQNPNRAAWSLGLLSVGLAGSFFTVLLQSRWKAVFGLLMIAAFALYAWEMRAILRARKRAGLDWGIRYFLTAIWLLAPLCVIGLLLALPRWSETPMGLQLEGVYGFVALIGVISFAIIGMLYKIAPFLVWFGAYSRHIGRAQVPALADMYSSRLQAVGYWTFLAGLLATSIAMLLSSEPCVRVGCILLAASLATLGINMGLILSHSFRPQLAPLQKAATKPLPV